MRDLDLLGERARRGLGYRSARPGHGGRSIGSAITSGDGLVTLLLQLA
jgi:hypothetical protein